MNRASLQTFEQVYQCLGSNADFTSNLTVWLGQNVRVCYLASLVDFKKTMEALIQLEITPDTDDLLNHMLLTVGGKCNLAADDMVQALLDGEMALFLHGDSVNILIDPVHPSLQRSISEPQGENVLQSSFDAFTENLATNMGLIRKQLKNKHLIMKTFLIGTDNPCTVGLFYMENKANLTVIQQIITRMENSKNKEAYNIQQLIKVLELPQYSVVPSFISTELTAETMLNLMSGKAVVMIDHFPIALSLPVIITDFWAVKTDSNQPILFMLFFRFIRILGFTIALLMPALYVALVSVNPEVLRIELALSIAKSRIGVPYPALVEVLLMLLIMEMVIEATIRLPKSIGPTITMIGGIILGQAIVQAQLVSNLLIIIVAATMIANLTLAGFQNTVSIRMLKYVILLFGSMYGVMGIASGLVWLGLYLAGITTYQVPFLSFSLKKSGSNE
ncbi:spore gernimation protein GerA [Paenibacillus sp. LMG 31456]|uniref:Spore gernimation protein GerA n=1 Tax=Paenibacillus foliorum TaxID=2654974 RepID=A0A972GXN6_9BACL|nr:spore germination protein [Paenibacillus foliorum]NOU96434.1 spore gernimation protein GerA [Paenibacillus foliorum]